MSYNLENVERFAGKEILFSKLSVSWFNAFENFLVKEKKAITTISIYMKTLRCVMNEAAAAGLVKEALFPFGRGKYIIPKGSSRSLSLSYDHIRKIVAYKGTTSESATATYGSSPTFATASISATCYSLNIRI